VLIYADHFVDAQPFERIEPIEPFEHQYPLNQQSDLTLYTYSILTLLATSSAFFRSVSISAFIAS